MQVIYGILNKLNGNQYVGSAKNFYTRKRAHVLALRNNKHHSIVLQRAWNKYTGDKFEFIILEKIEKLEDLLIREQWWIDNSNSEYNICKLAGRNTGMKMSDESKEKMRQAHLGEKHPEWRRKQKSEYTTGDKHWTKKKEYTEEAKKNMSEAQKELRKNGFKHQLCKAIIQLDDENKVINEWPSLKDAGKFFKLHPDTLGKYIKGKTNPKYKINIKYKNER